MKISQKKKERIFEQISSLLYSVAPKALFTSEVAQEIARDEEFIKKLLMEMKKKRIVSEVSKNPKGVSYLRRKRWKLSNEAFNVFKRMDI